MTEIRDLLSFEALLPVLSEAWSWVNAYFLDWASLMQLGAILCLFGLAWLIAPFLRRLVVRTLEALRFGPRSDRIRSTASALAVPIALFALLWLSEQIAVQAGWAFWLIDDASSLVTAWVAIRVATAFIRDRAWARIISIAVWFVAALDVVDLLDPTIKLLDEAGLTLGDLRLSAWGLIKGVVTLAVLLWLANLLSRLVERRITALPSLTPSVQVLFAKLLKIVLITIALVAALSSVGIDLTAFAVFSGAIGVGIGFGLQKVVANLISGIILLVEKSVKPGDIITVGNSYGRIDTLSARYVSVITLDGIEHLIPNEDLITQRVENWSYSNNLIRLRTVVGISYGADVRLAMRLCLEACDAAERVLAEPKPFCNLKGFGDSAVELSVGFWINDPMNGRANAISEVLLGIWDRFHEHGIEIPFPQRDLHLKSPDQIRILPEPETAE